MLRKSTLAIAMLLSLALTAPLGARAQSAGDLERVLRKLDAAAAEFRSTSADFQFDTVQTDPIPDKQVQKGTAYYERRGGAFRMGAHIATIDGRPTPKMYIYANGALKLYEGGNQNRVTTLGKAGQYESYLMLGFGASGKDLEQKWNIKDLGSETLAEGKTPVKVEKLELRPKDPAVARHLPKATIWVDPERGVSLKQVFDQGAEGYRVCVYFNIKVNQALPKDAFTLPVDSKTVYENR